MSNNIDPSVNPRGVSYLAGSVVAFTAALVTTSLRFGGRKIQSHKVLPSDFLIVISLLCSIGTLVLYGMMVNAGLGRHVTDLLVQYGKVGFINTSNRILEIYKPLPDLWVVSLTCNRISILDVYRTIFSTKRARLVIYCLMVLQVFGMIAEMCAEHLIGPTDAGAVAAYLSIHVLFLCLDLTIAVFPIPLVFGLQMKLQTKIGVCGLFGLGAGICIISALRIAFVQQIHATDWTYEYAKLYLWTVLEGYLGIVLANLPLVRPLLKQVVESIGSSIAWQKLRSTFGSLPSQRTGTKNSTGYGTSTTDSGHNTMRSKSGATTGARRRSDEENMIEMDAKYDRSTPEGTASFYGQYE